MQRVTISCLGLDHQVPIYPLIGLYSQFQLSCSNTKWVLQLYKNLNLVIPHQSKKGVRSLNVCVCGSNHFVFGHIMNKNPSAESVD